MNKTPEQISKILLFYAKHGWAVFPCKAGDKKPLTDHGFKDASTDPKQIAKWLKKCPNANWAIATGSGSGVFVVDADLKNGGRAAWTAMLKEHPPIETLVAQTGGGGLHTYFKCPNSGNRIKSGTDVLAQGIDIKGDGGYVIVPPSRTAAPYEFEVPPNKVEIAEAPAWLLELLSSPSPKPADTYTPLGQPLTVGNRNESIFHQALLLARQGGDIDFVLAAIRTWAQGQPDFPDSEIVATVQSAFKITDVAKHERKIEVRDAAYALMPHEPIEWLANNIIAKCSVNVLVGKFGSKKTWSALHLAVCIALGIPFVGIPTLPTRVLIIDEESGDTRMSIRMGDTLRGLQTDSSCPVYFISLGGFNLFKNAGDEALLRSYIQETGAGLVIIDALADIMAGGDENSVKDTQPVFAALKRISEETTAAILILHHTNRQDKYRGSSAIPGAVDVMLLIESDEDSKFINFKSEKNRDGLPIKFSAEAHWEEDKFYLTPSVNMARGKSYNTAQNYVIRFLTEHGASSKHDIQASADSCSPRAAGDAIYTLVAEGKIRRTNPGVTGKGSFAIYELVAQNG
jgi:hypothetical protein